MVKACINALDYLSASSNDTTNPAHSTMINAVFTELTTVILSISIYIYIDIYIYHNVGKVYFVYDMCTICTIAYTYECSVYLDVTVH